MIKRKSNIKEIEFDYKNISENYFTPENDKPFPLTVQKGNNIHNTTTKDGNYLYFSTDNKGNYDIWLRDLKSSIVVPLTDHPAAEYRPSISPDGNKIVYISEEEDNNGDIIIADIDSSQIVKNFLDGRGNNLENRINLTNLDKSDRYIDTEPSFSPDGKQIIFTSNRLSPKEANIVIMEIKNPLNIYRISEGGGSTPSFSHDGSKIIYVSYKYNKNGDIVILDIKDRTEYYATKDKNYNFSPSFSLESDTIYFSTIREDSNNDGVINEKDISRIVKKNIISNKEFYLTPSSYSSFDSKYSNFNGGSILYSASIYNSINIYFIPLNGFIPKKNSPQEQFILIKEYLKSEKDALFFLALDSMSLYFQDHELINIFLAKVESLKFDYYSNKRMSSDLNKELKNSINLTPKNSFTLYKQSLAYYFKFNSTGKSYINEMDIINKEFENLNEKNQIYGSFLEIYADLKYKTKNKSESIKLYNKILYEIPDYYNSNLIRLKMGDLVFEPESEKIPEIYLNLIDEEISVEDKVQALIDIETKVKSFKNTNQRIKHCEELIEKNNLKERSDEVYGLISFIRAEAFSEMREYQKSNILLDEITKPIPIIDPVCAFTPGCKQKMPCEKDRTCLKIHLLKARNNENLGNVNGFFEELKIFFQGYDETLKVNVDKSEVEKNFRYFEIKAREYESMGKLRESALNFFYNTENMYLLKEKNLHVNTIYKELGNYYYKKMVDSIIIYAKKQAEEEKESILNKINILSNEKLDLSGMINNVFSYIPENRLTKNLKNNLKIDLSIDFILGKPNKPDDSLKLIEQHFNLARPRSRPILYLSSLYGYAYYQIEKFIIYDEFYRNKGKLNYNNKEKILEGLKMAEYELKWIIFANQEYSDAYQLLGYLYQYIDLSKQRRINEEETEGELFFELYDKYFPGKNIEKNIDLYRQILTFLGKNINEKVESDIHLNLGNTFLYLNNNQKANENYKKVNDLSKNIIKEVQFSNYKQEAIFRFNFSRSLIYNSDFENAKIELLKLINLYESYETNNSNKKEKLIVIYTLLGYVYSELGEYENAIKFLKKSLAINNENHYIPTLSLYNYLSYNYIKNKDFRLALYYTQLARKEYNIENIFKIQIENKNLWNLLLPENLRTIGDSSITGKLSNDLQFLWTSGNELDIYVETLELNKAIEVIKEREDFLNNISLDNKDIRMKILVNDKKILGYLYNKFKYYNNSDLVYSTLLQINSDEFSIRAKLISNLLEKNDNSQEHIDKLKYNINELNRFKYKYLDSCEVKFNKNNLINTETREVCDLDFKNKYNIFNYLIGNLYYKLYLIYKEKNEDVLSVSYFSLFKENYNNEFIMKDNSLGVINKIRLLINSIYSLINDDEVTKLEALKISIKENNLNEENFLINNLLIEVYSKTNDSKKVENLLVENKNLLKYIVFTDIVSVSEIDKFHDLAIKFYFKKIQYQRIPEFEESKIRANIIRSFLQITFKFQNEKLQGDYREFQKNHNEFIKQNILLRNKQNSNIKINKKDLESNFYKFNQCLSQFIIKNPTLTNMLNLDFSSEIFKNYTILTKIGDKILLISPSKNLVLNPLDLDTRNINLGKYDSVISYVEVNSDNIEILKKINSLNYQKLLLGAGEINGDIDNFLEISEITKIPSFNSNFYVINNLENNSSNIFHHTDLRLKDLFEKDYFYNTVIIKEIKNINYHYLYKIMNFKQIDKIYFINNEEIIISSGLKNNKNTKNNFDFLMTSIYNNEALEEYDICIKILRKIDINQLNSKQKEQFDIVSLRLYSKNYLHKDKLYYYKEYLKGNLNTELSSKIQYEMIKYCLLNLNYSYCKKDLELFNKNLQSSKIEFNNKLNYKYNLNLYLSVLQNYYTSLGEDLNFRKDEDESEFLYTINNIKFLTKYYYLKESRKSLSNLSKMILSKEEALYLNKLNYNIDIISNLSGIDKVNLKNENTEDIYYFIIKRKYNKIIEYITLLKNSQEKDIISDYQIKLYNTYYKLEIGENYNPISLSPERLATNESIYSVLDDKDKFLLYYILTKSILNQTENEINTIFNQLIEPTNNLSPRIISYMIIGYIESAFQRGDLITSEYYLQKFEKLYSNVNNDPDLLLRVNTIKFKVTYMKTGVIEDSISNEYLNLFINIKKNPNDIYVLLNNFILSKANEKISSYEKREILDLLFILQKLALDLDSSDLFFNLGVYKDKISIVNERFYDDIYFKDIPQISNLSSELENKLPENQTFIGLFQFGLDLIKIKISDKKSNGKLSLKDSRIFRNEIFNYYNTINTNGSSSLTRESLETKFRKILLLEKKKRTYLYLSSYLQKVPMEYREDDNYFFVTSPDLIIKNDKKKYSEFLKPGFSIEYKNLKSENPLFARLEQIEIQNTNSLENTIHFYNEKIYLKELNKIYVNVIPILENLQKLKIKTGLWVISNSDLYSTSFLKEDLISVIQLYEKYNTGPFIFSLGPQFNETDNILFFKEFFAKSDTELNLKSRFMNGIKSLKYLDRKEISYIGYKIGTNCFLID